MFERFFGRAEAARREALKPDEKADARGPMARGGDLKTDANLTDQPTRKNPGFENWAKEAGDEGSKSLEGTKEFVYDGGPADAGSAESLRPHLELVAANIDSEPEEEVDLKEVELQQRFEAAQAKVAAAAAELEAASRELTAYQAAKDSVEKAA